MSEVKTMTPNLLNEAANKVKKYKGVSIPKEIKESEKDYYHVLIIDAKPNRATNEFDNKVRTQIFNKKSFEKTKDQYKKVGADIMIIFHNPGNKKIDVEVGEEAKKLKEDSDRLKQEKKDLEIKNQQEKLDADKKKLAEEKAKLAKEKKEFEAEKASKK